MSYRALASYYKAWEGAINIMAYVVMSTAMSPVYSTLIIIYIIVRGNVEHNNIIIFSNLVLSIIPWHRELCVFLARLIKKP